MKHVKKKSQSGIVQKGDARAHHSVHQSHPGIIKRLRRAEGNLRSVKGMIEQGRACVEVAPQLEAVETIVSEERAQLRHSHSSRN
jgi:uncharacterized protein